jgi:hypothetical protein
MQQFRTDPAYFSKVKRRIMLAAIPLAVGAIVFALIANYFPSGNGNPSVNILPMVIPLIMMAFSIGLYLAINRQKKLFDSFKITFSENVIARYQFNSPPFKIPFEEITEICKNADNSFFVKGKSVADQMIIPAHMENPAAIEHLLNQIKPVTASTMTQSWKIFYQASLTIILLGLLATVFISKNKFVVGITGSIVSAFMIFAFFGLYNNKNLDNKRKRNLLYIWIVVAYVIYTVYKKFNAS